MKKKSIDLPTFYKSILVGVLLFLISTGIMNASTGGETAPDPIVIEQQQQQQKTITGKVTDQAGDPVIGASVAVKGGQIGGITDLEGNFSLKNVPNGATVTVSYIGYMNTDFIVGNQDSYNLSLKENSQTLDEVVVVAYGTQKKVNLSGSVASVNVTEMLKSRPINNISNGLAGMVAGVQVTAASNRPGSDNSSILIRGQGTLNNSSPLVIIDGMEGNINSVNPQDIENFSVLKDAASSAIYGSRAANGVLLITTKQGKKGSVKIDYNGYVSLESIGKTYEPVSNYADYMELQNEGYANSKQALKFSQEKIDLWRANENGDPLLYPNMNWIDETFSTAIASTHNINMSGGTDKIRFYTSFGYMDNPGVMENSGYEKYDLRANVEAEVRPWLKLGTNLNGYLAYTEPGTDKVADVFTYGGGTTPGMVLRAPDGRYGAMNNGEDDAQAAVNNPLRRLNSITGKYIKRNTKVRLFGILMPLKGLSVTGSYMYELTDDQLQSKPVFNDGWNFQTNTITSGGTGRTSIFNRNTKTERHFMDAYARYETKMINNKLDFNTMVGTSQEQYAWYWFSASKQDLIDPSLNVIDGATADASAGGNRADWAMLSYFGRINLGWDDKYLLELNMRADASSRFVPDKRWGYFPSMSAAWRIDQESFMEGLSSSWLSNLKLRVSYGALGNNAVGGSDPNQGNYDYLSTYSTTNYILNNALAMGLSQTAIANAKLTWETTKIVDLGFDFGIWDNKLSGTVDYFNKKAMNILIDLPAPDVHGNASLPRQNGATVINQGLELTLNWRDKIGDLTYGIGVNSTWLKNKVTKFKAKEYSLSGASMIKEGLPINAQYVAIVDRIVQTDADLALVQNIIDNAPVDTSGVKKNPFAAYGTPTKGDFLYKDLNNDGLINDDDRTIVGRGPNPNFTYGFNVNLEYKGFDFAMLFQGVSGIKMLYMDAYYRPTTTWGYQIDKRVADGRWYEGRTDATFPRLLIGSDTRNNRGSDFWVQDKSYMKIKNIQLGYTLPTSLTKKVSVDRIRLYGSLENYFTFTNYVGMDPEVTNTGYPTMRQAVVGINLTF